MSELSMFFAQNAACDTTEEFVVSQRFKDKEGTAVAWKLRSMTEDENQDCRKAATRKVKGKNGAYTSEIDPNDYMAKLMTASVVHPDLKNAELQRSYGVMGAEALLRKMLLPGEFAALGERVQALNGFGTDMNELVDEVKN
ncbi:MULTISPECIES: phage tail assembly chaperone [Paenibacillus]|uniref:Phage XkdN-like tail assembly chaperone protein, TAC n=1 Tax=Paenibacillus typhae TaxID=1174501 RepID=A0A1G8QHI4_9BACL|nr:MULTISPECIES: phage portal protein [Paenibacillus]AIQ49522.1 phage portal protein [Paenibacillus sp. FSL R7-0273]KUP25884.1 phage portal protein [Paenibacillus sp. DMB5]MBY0014053.1 phage portal protein [Paenibacillus typhae]OMF89720.1 phage portal protein [Paenibacillus sp. FSL R7-0273]SDJ04108.1 Phage XkdN-like tail assembly chaperone protein, TAC [Paenibacillus typhae]